MTCGVSNHTQGLAYVDLVRLAKNTMWIIISVFLLCCCTGIVDEYPIRFLSALFWTSWCLKCLLYSSLLLIFFFTLVVMEHFRTWWQRHLVAVVVGIVVTLLLGLSILGLWSVWKRRQEASKTYQPVGAVVPEQELQPLQSWKFFSGFWLLFTVSLQFVGWVSKSSATELPIQVDFVGSSKMALWRDRKFVILLNVVQSKENAKGGNRENVDIIAHSS